MQIGGGVGRRLWTKVKHNMEPFWKMHETTIKKPLSSKMVTEIAVKNEKKIHWKLLG